MFASYDTVTCRKDNKTKIWLDLKIGIDGFQGFQSLLPHILATYNPYSRLWHCVYFVAFLSYVFVVRLFCWLFGASYQRKAKTASPLPVKQQCDARTLLFVLFPSILEKLVPTEHLWNAASLKQQGKEWFNLPLRKICIVCRKITTINDEYSVIERYETYENTDQLLFEHAKTHKHRTYEPVWPYF